MLVKVLENYDLLKGDPLLVSMAVNICITEFCNDRGCALVNDCTRCFMAEFSAFLLKRTENALDKKRQEG